ncbi:MAG TPA: DUF2480 family protein [Chitinophagales bacterium]|nr:DUF2480 family protein [Chitinophagales bacterium]HQO32124.1 DUF2480 family protein [Chitinophagales bacterium]HQO89253.1 DUF2480 family protein [Chitinophagales bacterium]
MTELLRNKVAESGIITLDLEQFYPDVLSVVELDIKQFLLRELILKEIDFRNALKTYDWSMYKDKTVAVYCSTDAIIPQWAYMLVATYLQPVAASFHFGNAEKVAYDLFLHQIKQLDVTPYQEERLVIKGCGTKQLTGEAYMEITKKLQPVVKSLMFGEPCSTVPVYKRKA